MAKTKRYRSIRSGNKKISIRSEEVISTSENTGAIKRSPEAARSSNAELRTMPMADRDLTFIRNEIFWILIVTGIVIILMLAAYFLFR